MQFVNFCKPFSLCSELGQNCKQNHVVKVSMVNFLLLPGREARAQSKLNCSSRILPDGPAYLVRIHPAPGKSERRSCSHPQFLRCPRPMALLGGAGPAVVAGLCAFAALGYAIYQVNISCPACLYELGRISHFVMEVLKPLVSCADHLSFAALQRPSLSGNEGPQLLV